MLRQFTWDDMVFWQSGEWQVIQERMDDMRKAKKIMNPERELLFAALDAVPLDKVKVVIMGQDPYPNSLHATGIAFSVPSSVKVLPPTLVNILREYVDDLHYQEPANGNLDKWCEQGVLLWNVIPSCEADKPASHTGWDEWRYLTEEIIKELNKRNVVCVFLGGMAREFVKFVEENAVLEYSHPSPRGQLSARTPFLGSRMFSAINSALVKQGNPPIDWKL